MENEFIGKFANGSELVLEGLDAPIQILKGFLLSNVAKERMTIQYNKERVYDYIQKNKTVFLSEISEKFKLDIPETMALLNKLKEEHKIVLKD